MYNKYFKIIDDRKDKIFDISDKIYDNPETSFKEFLASSLLMEYLEKNDFTITKNLAGMPTCFMASFGSGHPHVGVLAEYDGLSGMSQEGGKCVESAIPGKDTNHGCGHNLFAGGGVSAVLAIKEYIKEKGVGKITLFGCPAEEGGGGKVFMARDGVFNDVDAIVSHHPESFYMVRTRPALASYKKDYTFTGISAHAGAAPQHGRSALDAVELMNVGVNFLREHMDLTSRVHYAIIDAGGSAPNIVQSHATVRYMIRATDKDSLSELVDRVDKIAMGASLMTETTFTSKVLNVYSNLVTIPTLQKTADESMRSIPLPIPTEEEIAFGNQLLKTFKSKVKEGECPYSTEVLEPAPPVAHGGSTDTADVSWVCPTVQMHIGHWVKGTPGHSWQSASQSKYSYSKKAMLYAGKAIAGTVMRLFDNPSLIEKAKKEHLEKTGGKYIPLMPNDILPPV